MPSFPAASLQAPLPLSSGGDGVHNLYDPVQSRISANSHISATKVIVN